MLAFTGSVVISTGIQLEFTVTVTVNGVPVQVGVAGVTVYIAVPFPEGIVRVPLMLVAPVDWATPPVTPLVYVGAGHVYVVPVGTPVGVTVNVWPELMADVWGPTTGVWGWAFTVTLLPGETHPAELLAVTV
jgi:hypothetical protein